VASAPVTLLACGDVMTGRGAEQILPHPGAGVSGLAGSAQPGRPARLLEPLRA
jgi:hypothetical protein